MSYAAKALEAINDWERSTGAFYMGGPFFAREFPEGLVVFEIKNWTEGIRLSLIKTPPEYRGKGLASRALKELISFADKHGVPITASIDRQEDEGPTLTNAQLKKWYSRNGFKPEKYGGIRRAPGNAAKVVETLLEDEDPKDFLDRNDGEISKPPYTRYEDVLAAVKDHELFNDHDPGRFITFSEISGFRGGDDVAWEVYLDFKPDGISATPLYWYVPADGDSWQELEDIEQDYPGTLQNARAFLNGEINQFLDELSALVKFTPLPDNAH